MSLPTHATKPTRRSPSKLVASTPWLALALLLGTATGHAEPSRATTVVVTDGACAPLPTVAKTRAAQLDRSTRYYVALGQIKGVGDADGRVVDVTRRQMHKSAAAIKGFVFAPPGESKRQAAQRLRKHPRVHGYLFATSVERRHRAGTMTIAIKVSLFDYPHGSMVGSVTRTAAMEDVDADDAEVVVQLTTHATKALMRAFEKLAAR